MNMSHHFRTAEDYRDHLPCKECEPAEYQKAEEIRNKAEEIRNKIKRAALLQHILDDVHDEVSRAIAKFPPFNSAHEGWAVLYEEVDELWEEVRAKQGERHLDALRTEAIQVAAMAVRFAMDICNAEKVQK